MSCTSGLLKVVGRRWSSGSRSTTCTLSNVLVIAQIRLLRRVLLRAWAYSFLVRPAIPRPGCVTRNFDPYSLGARVACFYIEGARERPRFSVPFESHSDLANLTGRYRGGAVVHAQAGTGRYDSLNPQLPLARVSDADPHRSRFRCRIGPQRDHVGSLQHGAAQLRLRPRPRQRKEKYAGDHYTFFAVHLFNPFRTFTVAHPRSHVQAISATPPKATRAYPLASAPLPRYTVPRRGQGPAWHSTSFGPCRPRAPRTTKP